jgi:hypothetical protein
VAADWDSLSYVDAEGRISDGEPAETEQGFACVYHIRSSSPHANGHRYVVATVAGERERHGGAALGDGFGHWASRGWVRSGGAKDMPSRGKASQLKSNRVNPPG